MVNAVGSVLGPVVPGSCMPKIVYLMSCQVALMLCMALGQFACTSKGFRV